MKSFASLLAIASILGLSTSKFTIDPSTRTFRDEFGRARIFHGTNVVVKGPPYLPTYGDFDGQMSLNDEDIQNMKDWGIHLVRLGVMWESVETSEQYYNTTYLEEVDKLITKLGENGIFTLVDAHQDLFSRKTCGEGMPAFYVNDVMDYCPINIQGLLFKYMKQCKSFKDYDLRYDENGLPYTEDCVKYSFTGFYMAPEVSSSFEILYYNQTVQQRFLDFWDVVSKRLGGNEYVIGFDPINEPWPANFYKDFSLFYKQKKFDTQVLFPLLQKVHNVIRNNAPQMNYFFEPAQFPDTFPFFGGMVASIGFPELPGGESYQAYQVLNDHTYCCQADATMCATGEPLLEKKDTCKKFHERKVKQRHEDAQKFGVPLIFSEFGACSNSESCFYEITSSAEAFDNHLASWAYWMYKGFGDFTTTGSLTEGIYDAQGNIQMYKLLALTRTFLHATQGTPLAMKFVNYGPENGTFTGMYELDTSISSPSVIYFNHETYYGNGYKLTFAVGSSTPEVQLNTTEKNYIKFQINDDQFDDQSVSVVLTPVISETQNSVSSNDITMTYSISDLEEGSQQVKFEISGVATLGDSLQFNLKNANGDLICQGSEIFFQCEESAYIANSVEFSIFKQGLFDKTYKLQQKIANLNGHMVKIDVSKIEEAIY